MKPGDKARRQFDKRASRFRETKRGRDRMGVMGDSKHVGKRLHVIYITQSRTLIFGAIAPLFLIKEWVRDFLAVPRLGQTLSQRPRTII